ncbi:uncharacterized protein LOC106866169 isoform X2 [Brachypodium distachyon]|uniref:uncharacterized protein LOC106866169 isoform X2 n=1 Tax=Brachypodium distachyon TaxID=15368 RepID=UPI000D0D15C6|nr:uncharacterized protein LOC106866169 isoform X2 [Brachypodium distachyon]|eukprot:XP_024315569.1 uncharacterized protein LOC106866169 isoform X2 [Brachypodium distachyon]
MDGNNNTPPRSGRHSSVATNTSTEDRPVVIGHKRGAILWGCHLHVPIESNFIEVVGCPEVKDCRPSVIVSNFREITNFNDVTQHYLYCIYTHLDLRRPPSPSSAKLIEDVYEIVRDYTDEGDPGLTFRFIANSVNATEPVLRAAINKLIEQRRILRVIGDDRYILAHR